MSDLHQRQLERTAATGDRDAQAMLLLERVRAGALSKDRLRLAATLGHPPARDALGAPEPQLPHELPRWVAAFGQEQEVAVRVAIAAARRALQDHPEELRFDDVRAALEAAETWAVRHQAPRVAVGDSAVGLGTSRGCIVTRQHKAGWAAFAALELTGDLSSEQRNQALSNALDYACQSLIESSRGRESLEAWLSAVQAERLPSIWTAVREDLLPWALSHGDPVRSRVQDRAGPSGA